MSDYQNLALSLDQDGLLTISIDRADILNALNEETIDELRRAIEYFYENDKVKGVIVTGTGKKAFAAGADISEIAELNEMNARKFAENGQEVFHMLETSEKPVIAAVNGFALGGGCELAMACHLRVASANAKFGQPEVNLGIIPGYGGTQRLTHLVGKGKSLELMMTGRTIDAQEALQIALVNYVMPTHEEMMAKCKELLKQILEKAPLAIAQIIDCVNAVYNGANGFQTEANSFANCTKTEDFKEGTQAFLNKREPVFHGK